MKEPICPEAKCLASIALLADGGFQRTCEKFGMAQTSMSVFFREFLEFIISLVLNFKCTNNNN